MKITPILTLGLLLAAAACTTPAKPAKKAKGKKKAKAAETSSSGAGVEASKAPDLPPPPPAPPAESTAILPQVVYRMSSLQKNEKSVYFKDEFKNTADQLYATIRFERSYDYKHNVVLEPTFRTVRENPGKMDAIVLEQAFLDSNLTKGLYLTAGKKTEYEGSGFMVNPSDLLNEDKDLFDPLYQKEGKVFTRLRYVFEHATIGLGFVPKRGQEAKKGRGWLQTSATVKEAEIRLQAMHHETEKTTTGFSISRHFGDIFEMHYDGRQQSRQRDPTDVGQRYLTYSSYKQEDPSGYHLVGSRLVVSGRRTIVVEGIQQQSGLLPDEFKAYHAELQAEAQELNKFEAIPVQLHGRRYAFVSYQDDDTIKSVHIGLSYLSNLNDNSTFGNVNFLYHLSPITSIELSTLFFQGKDDTEFGEMPFPRATNLVLRGKF